MDAFAQAPYARRRRQVARLIVAMGANLEQWRRRPMVMSLRGIISSPQSGSWRIGNVTRLASPRELRILEQRHAPPRRDHQDRQQTCPAHAGGGNLELPFPGAGGPCARSLGAVKLQVS